MQGEEGAILLCPPQGHRLSPNEHKRAADTMAKEIILLLSYPGVSHFLGPTS